MDEQTLREIRWLVWQASQFLGGSSSNEVPYEVVGSLAIALNEWVGKGPVISTALLDSQEFYFVGVEPSVFIKRDLDPDFKLTLIQIAFPKLYKNSPLFNVPLYHELGHFIDSHYRITDITLLLAPPPCTPNTDEYEIHKRHRMEFFADLFAACYVGDTVSRFLIYHFGDQGISRTHPATASRTQNIEEFLNGNGNSLISLYQDALVKRGLPSLEKRFSVPDIQKNFDDFRPYNVSSDAEMHGLFVAGWDYYENAINQTNPVWHGADERVINRTVNDLIEKSIRNRMIIEKWNS